MVTVVFLRAGPGLKWTTVRRPLPDGDVYILYFLLRTQEGVTITLRQHYF
jgi:hypothetical protein